MWPSREGLREVLTVSSSGLKECFLQDSHEFRH